MIRLGSLAGAGDSPENMQLGKVPSLPICIAAIQAE